MKNESHNTDISNQILDLITRTHSATVTVIQVEYLEEKQAVLVNASSATEADSADYVDAVKESALVEAVDYTGYRYTRTGEYNFSIEVRLADTRED
jgi:hypothetical protein